ncbi:hypothetical protein Btru_055678 [Bulinus truncatus]|nr:hypothetical protein Btru_055678 [Bulinus truncatus]
MLSPIDHPEICKSVKLRNNQGCIPEGAAFVWGGIQFSVTTAGDEIELIPTCSLVVSGLVPFSLNPTAIEPTSTEIALDLSHLKPDKKNIISSTYINLQATGIVSSSVTHNAVTSVIAADSLISKYNMENTAHFQHSYANVEVSSTYDAISLTANNGFQISVASDATTLTSSVEFKTSDVTTIKLTAATTYLVSKIQMSHSFSEALLYTLEFDDNYLNDVAMDVSLLRLATLALFNAFFQYSLQLEMIISNSTTQVTLKQEDVTRLFSLLCNGSSLTIYFKQLDHITIIEDNQVNQSSQGCNEHDYKDACVQTSNYEPFFCTFNSLDSQISFALFCAGDIRNVFVIKTSQITTCYKKYIVLFWSDPTVKLQLNSQTNDWMLVDCSVNNISEENESRNDHKKPTDTNMLGLIIGLSTGGLLLLAVIIIAAVIIYRRANSKHQGEKRNLATSDTCIKHKPIGQYEEIDDVLNNGYSLAQPGVCQEKERTQDLPVETSETDVTSQYNPIDTYSTIDPKTSATPIVVPVTKQPDPQCC